MIAQALQRIREHFSVEGTQLGFLDGAKTCCYRGKQDPKSPVRCSVGVLIPDEAYVPSVEGRSADSVLQGQVGLAVASSLGRCNVLTEEERTLLGRVQIIHDSIAKVDNGEDGRKAFLVALDAVALFTSTDHPSVGERMVEVVRGS